MTEDGGILALMRWSPLWILLVYGAANAELPEGVVTAGEWALPRSGTALLKNDSLARVVRHLIDHPGDRLVLHYPGGDEGVLWAGELRGWLVALGIASERVVLMPGGTPEQIIMSVERDGQH